MGEGITARSQRVLAVALCLALAWPPAAPACAHADEAPAAPGERIAEVVPLEGPQVERVSEVVPLEGAQPAPEEAPAPDAGAAPEEPAAPAAPEGGLSAWADASRTRTDVPLSADEPRVAVGTLVSGGLAFALNNDGVTATFAGWAGDAPEGVLAVPATVESGGDSYRVTGVGASAGGLRGSRVEELVLPAGVEDVDPRALEGCPTLAAVRVDAGNAAYASFDGALYNKDLTALVAVPEGKAGTLALPAAVDDVPAGALKACAKLGAVSVPDECAAYSARGGLLYDADGTTLIACPPAAGPAVALPAETQSVAAGALAGCTSLRTIAPRGAVAEVDAEAAPPEVRENASVALPAGVDVQEARTAWERAGFARFAEVARPGDTWTGTAGEGGEADAGFAFTLLDDGTASVSWRGEAEPPERLEVPASAEKDGVAYRVAVAPRAFAGRGIVAVALPASVQVVGEGAFEGCARLERVELPEGLATIGARAFAGTALADIALPASTASVGAAAFDGCAALERIVALGDVSAPDPAALDGCAGVEVLVPRRDDGAYAWNVGVPASGNHLAPYGVALAPEPLELAPGGEASALEGGSAYVPESCALTFDCPSSAFEVDAEGVVRAQAPGEASVAVTLAWGDVVLARAERPVTAVDPEAAAEEPLPLPVHVFASLASAPAATEVATPPAVGTHFQDNQGVWYTVKTAATYDTPGTVYTKGNGYGDSLSGPNKDVAGDIVIPETLVKDGYSFTVTGIGDHSFRDNEVLTSIKLPRDIEYIGTDVFSQCTSLVSFDASAVTRSCELRGTMYFQNCQRLQSVSFGRGIRNMPRYMFYTIRKGITLTVLGNIIDFHPDFVSDYNGISSAIVYLAGGVVDGATFDQRAAEWRKLQYRGARFKEIRLATEDDPELGLTFSKVSDTELSVWATDPATIEVAAIPATHPFGGVDGFAVTVIEQDAFKDAKNLCSVTVPESVREIRSGAFAGCDNADLASIALPSTLQSIGARAFQGCTALAGATVAEPGALQTIGDSAFEGSGLRAFQIPSSVTAIGAWAFANCAELASVNLDVGESQLTSCGASCYEGCVKLKALAFSKYLAAIPDSFAKGCASLTTVYSNGAVATVGASAFEGCSQLKEAPLSDKTATIGAAAFSGCAAMAVPTLPNGLISIGERAFEGCRAFDKVEVPYSVTSLGAGAFKGCDRLESAKLGGSITATAAKEGVTVVPASAFQGCTALSKLICYGDVTTVDKTALDGVETSRLEVYLRGESVEDAASAEELAKWKNVWSSWTFALLSPYAFVNDVNRAPHDNKFSTLEAGCRVYIGPPKAWEGHVFGGWYSDKDVWEDLWPNNDSGLDPHVMPAHGVTLYARWFASGSQVTDFPFTYTLIDGGSLEVSLAPGAESVSVLRVPKTHAFDLAGEFPVTRVADGGFEGALAVRSVELPDSITEVGARAFKGCTALEGVTLPASVTKVGERAFQGCTSLERAEFAAPSSLVELGAGVFERCSALREIALPKGLSAVPNDAFSGCGSLAKVGFAKDAALMSIGDLAFYGCAFSAVRLPSSLQSVGKYAFAGCPNLQAAELPDAVTTLGEGAFSLSLALKVASLGAGITVVPDNAFFGCPLETIFAAGPVTTINKLNSFKLEIKDTAYVVLPDTADFDTRAKVWTDAGFKNVGRVQTSYKVTFDENNPSATEEPAKTNLAYGTKLTAPDPPPTREDYMFTGWYRDAAATARWDFDADVMPPYDVVLYAGWQAVDLVRVTVPVASPVIGIDASGAVTAEGGERAFRIESTSLQPVRIASITSTAAPGALSRLFPAGGSRVRLTFTEQRDGGDVSASPPASVALPVDGGAWTCTPGYAPDFVVPTRVSADVPSVLRADFGLDIPADEPLAFLSGGPLDFAEVSFTFATL